MTAILLALLAALAYGASDFIGGRASTRAHFALVTAIGAAAATAVGLTAAVVVGGELTAGPLTWGIVSGVGSGMGTLFLYRGLARARIAVVAPISGVLAAALPAGLAVLFGERPGVVSVIGLVLALPAVWLISGGGSAAPNDDLDDRPSGVVDGVLAGFGFGLLFFAIDRAGDDSGLWPLSVGQAVALLLVTVIAVTRLSPSSRSELGAAWALAVLTGLLGSLATLLFYASTTTGLLTIAAVLTSLYPAATILLARILLNERMTRRQGFGLLLAGCAVVLITIG